MKDKQNQKEIYVISGSVENYYGGKSHLTEWYVGYLLDEKEANAFVEKLNIIAKDLKEKSDYSRIDDLENELDQDMQWGDEAAIYVSCKVNPISEEM